MKPTTWLAALAAMTASCNALAVGDVAQVTIIDRSTGAVLTPHLHHGEYWVAGRPGATYAIEIHNRLDERVLAVTSVDGVNVISGATAAWNQTGYVFRPQQDYRITGWRKSDDEVAAFTFTASPNSYAARTGRPANVGVIGVAVFRERQQPQVFLPPPRNPLPTGSNQRRRRLRGCPRCHLRAQQRRRASSLAAPGTFAILATPVGFLAVARSGGITRTHLPAPLRAPKLGTGHGEREYSHVENTEFERRQTQPDEIIRIRYDSLDNLVAMGIVARPRPPAQPPTPSRPRPNSNMSRILRQRSAETLYSLKSVELSGVGITSIGSYLNVYLGPACTMTGHAHLL